MTRTGQAIGTQRWVLRPAADELSTYTIQQLSDARTLDAHTTAEADFHAATRAVPEADDQINGSVVTGTRQDSGNQQWIPRSVISELARSKPSGPQSHRHGLGSIHFRLR